MHKFYTRLWLYWAGRVTLETLLFAFAMALFVTLFFYVKKGAPALEEEVVGALWSIFAFWFKIVWAFAFLLVLFRSIKWVFERCYAGYRLRLRECATQRIIEEIGYGDLVRVWRRWFVTLVWIITLLSVIISALMHFLAGVDSFFAWFDIWVLYLLSMTGGYISFWLLGAFCKRVKVERC